MHHLGIQTIVRRLLSGLCDDLGFCLAPADDYRRNEWVLTQVKPVGLSDDQWITFLEADQEVEQACKAAMAAFQSSGSIEALCTQFLDVASRSNNRTLPPHLSGV
jgi:hypothetical protein